MAAKRVVLRTRRKQERAGKKGTGVRTKGTRTRSYKTPSKWALALKNPDARARKNVFMEMGKKRPKEGIALLRSAVVKERDQDARAQAIMSLGQYKRKEDQPLFLNALKRETSWLCRLRAAYQIRPELDPNTHWRAKEAARAMLAKNEVPGELKVQFKRAMGIGVSWE